MAGLTSRLRRHSPAALVAALAVVLLTWPLAARLTTALPNAGGDGLENVWNVWWARQALLLQPSNVFWASSLYHPGGTSLLFHALGLAAAPIAIPLQAILDPTTALNLTFVLLLWLTAMTTYLLAWELVRLRAAALLAGIMVALAPAHLYHLLLGQINLTAFFPVPFILFAQQRALRRRQWRWLIAATLGIVVCALADWQYLVQAGLLGGLLLLATLWQQRRRPIRLRQALVWGAGPFLLGGLLLLPLVLAMIADLRANEGYAVRPEWQIILRSTDLAALITPSPYHPLWGATSQALHDRYYPRVPLAGGVASLSLVALTLAATTLLRHRPLARRWWLLLLIGTTLALGPFLHLAGQTLAVPMPYQLTRLIPYMDVMRVPAVYLKWAVLALAILTALGLRGLLARWGRRGLGRPIALVVSGLIIFEGLAVPLQLPDRPVITACYRQLAADPGQGAVLDLPLIDANQPMYFQTLHRRPIIGGDLSRDNPYPFLNRAPIVGHLAHLRGRYPQDIFIGDTPAERRSVLAGWEIGWIVLRTIDAEGELPRYESMINQLFADVGPVCSDELTRLYRVEPGPAVVMLGDGWRPLERLGDGAGFRWLDGEGSLLVGTPTAGPATLEVTGWAFRRPRTVELLVGETSLGQVSIPTGRETIQTIITLPAGRSLVRLRPVEPAERADGADTRQLSVAVTHLALRSH